MKSHSGKRRTPVCLVEATGRQGTTLHPSRSRVAELYAFDEQIRSSFYERRTPVCLVEATGRQGATLRPSVASGFMPDVEEKTSQTSCDATGLTIAGFDEAGRGALAGPVVVGCVHFPDVLVASGLVPDERSVGSCPQRIPTSQTSCDATAFFDEFNELDDSKRLSPQKREALYKRICTVAKWGVGWASHSVIDRHGIVPALTLAAHRAYRAMGQPVDLLLLDRGLSLHERPSSKASTAEDAKTAEHYYKKEGSLCELGDLCGEMKRSSLASCDATPELAFTKGDAQSLHIAAASILAKVSRDRMMIRIHARFPDYGFDRNKGYGTA
ncbi:MAG TPA: ribonuclease HII, partial [Candidatus Heimdallarchaeota archaeon]|nr:ribonuclease HII [Candidatus Heimdallarchaeota archaeon]